MPSSIKISVIALVLLAGCTKKESTRFGVNDLNVYEDKASKTKLKSEAEYISIVHTNLFQKPVSPTELFKAQSVIYSIGDKTLAYEVVLSNYFNRPGVVMPTITEMKADPDKFIRETYLRFFLREPSEGELTWFRNFLKANPNINPELVYTAFASSDEYAFY